MIATEEIVVTKKLKIKFATKRFETEPGNKSCGFGRNESHAREWENCNASNDQSKHGTITQQNQVVCSSGEVFSAIHVKVELPVAGANKRDSSGMLKNPNNKRLRMDRGMTQQCSRILKKLMTHPAGWVFNQPVDPEKLNIPDYFSVISEPMDLGTIKSKLEKKLYYDLGEFVSDIRLTFSNAMLYNPSSNNVHLMAKELNNIFSASWKSLDEKWNYKSLEVKGGNVLSGRARKVNVSKLNCQKRPSLLTLSLLKRSMSFEDRQKLGKELCTILKGKVPPQLQGPLQRFGLTSRSEEGFQSNIDALDDGSLWELRKLITNFIDAKAAEAKLVKTTEPCGSRLVKKSSHKGTDSGNKHAGASANSDSWVIPASLKCGLCVNATCKCGAETGSTHESSSGLSSTTQDYTATDFHAPKLIANSETHPCGGLASLTRSSKSEPNSDGGVSPVDDENIFPSSHDSAPITTASSGEEWRTSTIDIQLSPKRALRAALLKSRFADTILKAQQRTLLDHGDKSDPEKLQQEKERLEKQQQEEKARIKAEIVAAEAASRIKTESELKMQREKEREAARIAVQKIEKTVEIDENLPSLKDLELLSGFSPDIWGQISCASFLSPRIGNPLERLGLFMKDEYLGNDEEDEDMILNGGGEEGEIVS